MTASGEDPALDALRHGWSDAYEFGTGVNGYWARRLDGIGETMTARDPGDLRQQVYEDYGMKPVRTRRPA
jgi:hypothetical protein